VLAKEKRMLPPIGEEEEDDLQVGPEMPKAKKRKVKAVEGSASEEGSNSSI